MVDAKATTRNNRAQCDNNLGEDDEIPIKTKKRKLRPKKTREKVLNKIKEYIQDSTDEEDDFVRKFDLDEKLTCERYLPENNPDMIFEKQASEITLEYFQRNDFETPILIKENIDNGLELKMPPSSDFWVDDVKQLVGPRRIIDVMNVETQEAETMSMKEWAVYFNKPERDRLLNLISLEFSHTKLDTLIDSPKFVKSMDWVDLVWPRHLKKQQKEGTNALQDMKYPKVQKYCLMSVGKCYTDFHIDFSGTSVWYHIFRGGKVFWLIPPTEKNIKLYEEWTLSGKQSHIFFGDTVEECVRVDLTSGNTFLIPTGWIHAVYTTEDSLVFGGNFLHSLGIRRQIRSAEVEVATKVGKKFRYPFFIELLWYVIIRYVHCLTGKNYLCFDDDGKSFLDDGNDDEKNKIQAKEEPEDVKEEIKEVKPVENAYDTETEDEEDDKIEELQRKYEEAEIKRKMKLKVDRSKFPSKPYVSFTPSTWTHLRQKEMDGLEYLINWLDKLPPLKKSIPEMLISPEGLLRDARKMLEDHKNDDQELAISGNPSLFWITKDFLNSTKQNRVKKPRKSKKVKNELATENGTSELTESVNFNNFSASLMQDSNNKINSGSTIKQSAIPTGLMSLIAQTGVNQMGNGQVMHQQQLQQQQPPSGFQSNNGVAVMQPAAQYGAPFRPIPRPAPMHHVAPQQTYMQPHMGPVHAQRMVYSHQPPNSMIVKVPHSYAQQAQALQVAPAATIMNHHPAYVQQTSYYAPNVHVQQQQQPQHPQQHLPQQQPQQSQQPQTQQQQQPPPPQPQQNHHYSVPNYGPSPGVNYYVRAAPQPQYQTPQYHYVHNTAGPAQPYPQTMHVAPQYQPQAIYVASQTQPTQVPHPQQHQYYTHTNGHVQTYAPVQQHPIQPQQPPAQQHLPPQQYHQYSYPSQY